MKKTTLLIAVAVAAIVTFAAQGQVIRSFVASSGSDSNTATNCQRTAPCKTFQAAHGVTSAGGEVVALDAFGVGPVTVTKSITFQGGGFAFIAPTTGQTGIAVNAGPSDVVILKGIQIVAAAGAASTTGVSLGANAGRLIVDSCSFRNLTVGLDVTSNKAFVTSSQFYSNGTAVRTDGTGAVQSTNQWGPTLVTLRNLELISNTTAFTMNNPGSGPCNFTQCRPACPTVDYTTCGPYPQNKITIFAFLQSNSGGSYDSNIVGNTTLTNGSGTGCTDPDGGTPCTQIGSYGPSENPH